MTDGWSDCLINYDHLDGDPFFDELRVYYPFR